MSLTSLSHPVSISSRSSVSSVQSVSPSLAKYSSPGRKYYHITPRGRERIDAFLEEWDEMKQVYTFVQEESAWNSQRF